MNSQIHCITLPVSDLAKSLAFYSEGLGLRPRADAVVTPETDHLVIEPLHGPMLVLTLHKDFADFTALANLTASQRGSVSAILSCFAASQAEVDTLLTRSLPLGGTLPKPAAQHPWGYAGYLADPDGHLWEILWNPALTGSQDLPPIPESDYGVRIDPSTVRLQRILPGPIERVWDYLTDPAKRATWFASGPIALRVGGEIALHFDHRNITTEPTPEAYLGHIGAINAGHVTQCDPPRLLAYTWEGGGCGADDGGDSEVTFELAPHGDGVLLTLTHSKLPDRAEMLNVSGGWHTHLGILEDRLNNLPTRGFWSNHARLTDEYAKRFPES